jgi:hypothetical protein
VVGLGVDAGADGTQSRGVEVMDGTSLIPLESINAVEVFTGAKLDDLLAKIRAAIASGKVAHVTINY